MTVKINTHEKLHLLHINRHHRFNCKIFRGNYEKRWKKSRLFYPWTRSLAELTLLQNFAQGSSHGASFVFNLLLLEISLYSLRHFISSNVSPASITSGSFPYRSFEISPSKYFYLFWELFARNPSFLRSDSSLTSGSDENRPEQICFRVIHLIRAQNFPKN